MSTIRNRFLLAAIIAVGAVFTAGQYSPQRHAEGVKAVTLEAQMNQTSKAKTVSTASSPRSVGFIKIRFQDTTSTPPSDAAIKDKVEGGGNSLDRYYREVSGNITGFNLAYLTTVTIGSNTPADSSGACTKDFGTTLDTVQKEAAANAPGFNPASYDHDVYLFPPMCGFKDTATSSSSIGMGWHYDDGSIGPGMNVFLINGMSTLYHEVGHNLSFDHSSLYTCNRTPDSNDFAISGDITLNDACSVAEYIDIGDIMGWHKEVPGALIDTPGLGGVHYDQDAGKLGWSTANLENISGASGTSITRDIAPMAAVCNQVKILKIQRNGKNGSHAGDFLYVDYRQATSGVVYDDLFTSSYSGSAGIEIRVPSIKLTVSGGGTSDSEFLGVLKVGKTLTDSYGKVNIRLNSLSAKGANVTVTYN